LVPSAVSTLPLVALGLLLQQAPAAPVADADVNPPEVRPPFACGLAFPVSQAHDTGSHRHTDTWAWDFRMPEGTPITAAADGEVRLARGDSTRGGCDESFAPDANYVVLRHLDGTETQYLHFLSVVVRAGQKVRVGELLGYAGKTGWACGAHLHFKVTRAGGAGWNNPSIPAHIAGYGDPGVDSLVEAGDCPPEPPAAPRWVRGPGHAQGVPAVALPPVP
jgi:murein DD-endopeptidase MepM/ murein hydrolase activator NlpD